MKNETIKPSMVLEASRDLSASWNGPFHSLGRLFFNVSRLVGISIITGLIYDYYKHLRGEQLKTFVNLSLFSGYSRSKGWKSILGFTDSRVLFKTSKASLGWRNINGVSGGALY